MSSNEVTEFNQLKSDISTLVMPTMTIKVTSPNSAQTAIHVVKQVKEYLKSVEKKRKDLVDPLNNEVKRINAYAKEIEQPLLKAEAYIKGQLVAFEQEQERIREAARKSAEAERLRLEAEHEAKEEAERQAFLEKQALLAEAASVFGDDDDSVEHAAMEARAFEEEKAQERAVFQGQLSAKDSDIEEIGIKGAKKIWKCELLDIEIVPKEYQIRTLNNQAVLAMARAGIVSIPGVRIWQETSIAIGSATYIPRNQLK